MEIKNKWYLDNGGAIYLIKDQLLFYTKAQDPHWNRRDEIPRNDIMKTKCYRQRTFHTWDDIPNNCAMAF